LFSQEKNQYHTLNQLSRKTVELQDITVHNVSEVKRLPSKKITSPWIRERSKMVQMQGGNDVDYPGVISTCCQRSRCAVIGRRGEDQQMSLFRDNAMNSTDCMEYRLKPSRIQEILNVGVAPSADSAN